jgi:2-polyprenyl-3-methyl-5-hydroxy-6-metoxy-1,4-benzoquinol methylase
MKQTPATDIFNQTIFDILPNDTKKILEIGTGSGAMANAYKQINADVNYVGVEIDPEYQALSERYCNTVYLENFESPTDSLLHEVDDADFIIFSDVLEHMYNPWKVLKNLSERVPEHCRILASIPNIQHWSIQIQLLNGDFEYADSGLLDRTHVRFFTRKTMVQLFTNNGFSINQVTPRIFNFPNQDAHLSLIRKNAELLNINVEEAVIDAASFQLVIDAQIQTASH